MQSYYICDILLISQEWWGFGVIFASNMFFFVWICAWLLCYNNYYSQKIVNTYANNVNILRIVRTLHSSWKEGTSTISEFKCWPLFVKSKWARNSQALSSDPCRADSRSRCIFNYLRQSKVTGKFEETSSWQRHQELGTGMR